MVWTIEQLEIATGINKELLENIRSLAKKEFDSEAQLNDSEAVNVQNVIAQMIGNMSTNKLLGSLAEMSARDTGIPTGTAAALKDLSYRTRNLKKIESDLDHIWDDFEEVKAGKKKLNENEKISLNQYGILFDLAALNKTLERYNGWGLIKGNAELEKLYNQTQRAATMISHYDETFNQEFRMPAGTVVFDNTHNKSQIYGKELGFFEKIIAFFVSKFGHVSKGLSVENDGVVENKISHINPTYKEEKFSLRNFLYSDVYRIKLENLIDQDTKTLLKEQLGIDWLSQLEKKYADIERQIHDGSRSEHCHIEAEGGKGRFTLLGLAPFLGGHKNFFMSDHNNADIRDDILGRGKWAEEGKREVSKILCSEFIGKTIIAAVQELNDVVKEQLKEKGVEHIPEIIIKSPLSQREKLYLLTPERLLTAMQERGALERVQTPVKLNQFFSKGPVSSSVMEQERNSQEQIHATISNEEISDSEEIILKNGSAIFS